MPHARRQAGEVASTRFESAVPGQRRRAVPSRIRRNLGASRQCDGYALLLRFALLRHFERKLLRALPCKPFSSACFEHSIEAALRAEGSLLCAHAAPAVAMSPVRRMASIEMRMAIDLSRTDRRPKDNASLRFWVRVPGNKSSAGTASLGPGQRGGSAVGWRHGLAAGWR